MLNCLYDSPYLFNIGLIVAAVAVSLYVLQRPTWIRRIYPKDADRNKVVDHLVTIVVIVTFSVIGGSYSAGRSERESHRWAARQKHLDELRPTLRREAENLDLIHKEIEDRGYFLRKDYRDPSPDKATAAIMWPEVMSQHLPKHYRKYEAEKRTLLQTIEEQNEEYFQTGQTVADGMGLAEDISFGRERIGFTYVDECIGKGPGFFLEVKQDSYRFHYWSGAAGGEA